MAVDRVAIVPSAFNRFPDTSGIPRTPESNDRLAEKILCPFDLPLASQREIQSSERCLKVRFELQCLGEVIYRRVPARVVSLLI